MAFASTGDGAEAEAVTTAALAVAGGGDGDSSDGVDDFLGGISIAGAAPRGGGGADAATTPFPDSPPVPVEAVAAQARVVEAGAGEAAAGEAAEAEAGAPVSNSGSGGLVAVNLAAGMQSGLLRA